MSLLSWNQHFTRLPLPLQQIVTSDLRSFSHISPLLLVSSSLISHYTLNLTVHVIFEGPALLSFRSLTTTTTTRIMKRSVVENILRIFIRSGRPGRHKGQMTEKTRRRNPGHPSMTVTLKTQGRTFGHPKWCHRRTQDNKLWHWIGGSQTLLKLPTTATATTKKGPMALSRKRKELSELR